MSTGLLKKIAMRSVSSGLKIPELLFERVNEMSILKSLLDEQEINCVLDVGANRGQFAQELRGIGYRGQIISFEPLRSEFAKMSEIFKDDPKWTGFNIALGSENGEVEIKIPNMTVFSSFLDQTNEAKKVETEIVTVRRLDEVMTEIEGRFSSLRMFLKMDTQGFDLEVFRGAGERINEMLGLQSEVSVNPIYKGMPHYLESLGVYEAAGLELINLSIVNRTKNGGIVEFNALMRRIVRGVTH